ncbi:hypothetical protein D7Y56_30180 [Streptomyces sp. S501]|nr:hypothetical protein D7Y56_30180 [Streptomyces sp. S501]
MPDPRARRGRWYSLTAILLVVISDLSSGPTDHSVRAAVGRRSLWGRGSGSSSPCGGGQRVRMCPSWGRWSRERRRSVVT